VADVLALAKKHDLVDRGFGLLFVDTQPINLRTYYTVTDTLCARFGVSRTALKLRLQKLGLLNDSRGEKEPKRLFYR
jgi:Zn-dependent peptidase ImmA (M78 family)